jgi:hypothetical protein
MIKLILTLTILFSITICNGQIIKEFPFEKYPSKISSSKKAPLKLSSHKLGKTYRTAIKRQYTAGKIDFGGHFVIVLWGCGTGCSDGAMVDTKTGIIYSIPIDLNNSYRGGNIEENHNIKYKADSKLFVCYSSNREDENKLRLDYYYYSFDEKLKKFNLIKKEKKYATEELNE